MLHICCCSNFNGRNWPSGSLVARIGHDSNGGVVVQGQTQGNNICFSKALVSAHCDLWVWFSWRLSCDALACSKDDHWVLQFQGFLGGNPLQAIFSHSLFPAQSHLALAVKQSVDGSYPCCSWRCLKSPSHKPRPTATVPDLWLLSQKYKTCQRQMLLVWVLGNFEWF